MPELPSGRVEQDKRKLLLYLWCQADFFDHTLSYFMLISQQNSSWTSSSVKRSVFQLWFILFISHEENFRAALWNLDACSRIAELTVATFIQYKMKYIQARCLGNCYTVKLNFKSHFTKINWEFSLVCSLSR